MTATDPRDPLMRDWSLRRAVAATGSAFVCAFNPCGTVLVVEQERSRRVVVGQWALEGTSWRRLCTDPYADAEWVLKMLHSLHWFRRWPAVRRILAEFADVLATAKSKRRHRERHGRKP